MEGGLRAYHRVKAANQMRDLPPVEQRLLVPSEDPELVFEHNPGWQKDGYTVNSHGMADEETTLEKPAGVFRIAFVGDSISANFGFVPREEIYLEVLAQKWNAQRTGGPVIESLNFGVNAYGILQTLRVAESRTGPFDPDLIVVQLFLNDPYPSDTEYGRFAPLHPFRLRNFLFRTFRPQRFWSYFYVERAYDDRGRANVRKGLEGFAELASGGPPVVAVLFPYLYRPAYESWGYGRLHDLYHREAKRVGLPLLDLHDTFAEAGLIDDRWPKDVQHPDSLGHEIAAEALLDELASRGLIPAPTAKVLSGPDRGA